jgi:DNA-binding response OmpR family regulator
MDSDLQKIPVFIHSAHDGPEERMRALKAGAMEFVPKGSSPEEMKIRLNNISARHNTVSQSPGSAQSPVTEPVTQAKQAG